jgi:hypothetical protein
MYASVLPYLFKSLCLIKYRNNIFFPPVSFGWLSPWVFGTFSSLMGPFPYSERQR